MIKGNLTISTPAGKMPAYLARPETGVHPAVIVLEGVYGFDDEMRRMTDLVAGAGFVGIAIDYLRGQPVDAGFRAPGIPADIAATRDWLNDQPFVARSKVALWGFGIGGSVAFMAASLPGLSSAIAFYGQSIAKALPDGCCWCSAAATSRSPKRRSSASVSGCRRPESKPRSKSTPTSAIRSFAKAPTRWRVERLPTRGIASSRSCANISSKSAGAGRVVRSFFDEQAAPALVDVADVIARFGIRRNTAVIAHRAGPRVICRERERVRVVVRARVTCDISG